MYWTVSKLQPPRMQPQVHRIWVNGIGMGLDFPSGSILHFALLLAGQISIGVSWDCLEYSEGTISSCGLVKLAVAREENCEQTVP